MERRHGRGARRVTLIAVSEGRALLAWWRKPLDTPSSERAEFGRCCCLLPNSDYTQLDPGSPRACPSIPSSAMDASSIELTTSILDWDENDVHIWLSKLGFPQYEQQVRGTSPPSSVDTNHPPTLSQSTTYPAMSYVYLILRASRRWGSQPSANVWRF